MPKNSPNAPSPTSPANLSASMADRVAAQGLRSTGHKTRILQVFSESKQRHLSADDVYRLLVGAGEEIGIATVYRVLAQFEQAGILARRHFSSHQNGGADAGKAVYELDEGTHHDHLVCIDCGQVLEFYDAAIERQQQQIAKDRGFALHEHALSLYAHCIKPQCEFRKT